MTTPPNTETEETRFVHHMARRFDSEFGKTFGAVEGSGVILVVVRADTDKAAQLRKIVIEEWHGVIEPPRVKG